MNRFLLVAIVFGVAACATPGVDEGQSGSVQRSDAIQTGESAGESTLAQNQQAEVTDGIEEFDTPVASETPPESVPNIVEPEPAIVCERVVPTGSILPVKVCRHQTDIKRKGERDREMFDDMKRNTALGTTRL